MTNATLGQLLMDPSSCFFFRPGGGSFLENVPKRPRGHRIPLRYGREQRVANGRINHSRGRSLGKRMSPSRRMAFNWIILYWFACHFFILFFFFTIKKKTDQQPDKNGVATFVKFRRAGNRPIYVRSTCCKDNVGEIIFLFDDNRNAGKMNR